MDFKQFIKRYNLVYSPRTTLLRRRDYEQGCSSDMIKYFDPFTLNFLKREFEANNGSLEKTGFISCLKSHLLQWKPNEKDRDPRLVKYLSMIFDDIDLISKDKIDWEEFSNYLISKASESGGNGPSTLQGGPGGKRKTAMAS